MRLATAGLPIGEHCAVEALHESIIEWLDELVVGKCLAFGWPNDRAVRAECLHASGRTVDFDPSFCPRRRVNNLFTLRLLVFATRFYADTYLESVSCA